MGYGEIVIKAEETESTAHSLSNPVRDADGSVTWDCVWFGSYPQTEIVSEEDSTQLAAMEKMNTYYETKYETVDASDYQKIAGASYNSNGDATVNGVTYRRMKKGDATYFATDSNNYYQWADSESYHYFRYEPIKWRVLSVKGSDAFLLSDTGLDNKEYDEYSEKYDDEIYDETYTGVTWEISTMRSWLNGYSATSNTAGKEYSSDNFLDIAFSSAEQEAILSSTVITADNPYTDRDGGNDTTDKVFLLSVEEGLQSAYGFATECYEFTEARQAKTSTYAKAMGCFGYTDADYAGCDSWWLRSPSYYVHNAVGVNYNGYLDEIGTVVGYKYGAVRPALHLNLSSSLCSYAGTVSIEETTEEESGGDDSSTTTENVTTGVQTATTTTQSTITTQQSSAATTNQQPQGNIKTTQNKPTAPDKVKGVVLSRVGSGKLKVSYKKVRDAKGYQISYSTNKHFANAKKLTVKNNRYTIKKLKKGKTYYVRVRAYKLDGSKKVYGKWSSTKKIKVK